MRPASNSNRQDRVEFEKYLHAQQSLQAGVRPFVPVVVRSQEIGLRPRSEISSVLDLLVQRVDNEILHPLLRAESTHELEAILGSALGEFIELMRTLGHLLTLDSSVDNVMAMAEGTAERAIKDLCERVHRFAGSSAADEVRFAAETYAAALHAARRVVALVRTVPEERERESRPLASAFQVGAALHQMGALLLTELANGYHGTDASISFAFDALRGGAIHAYAAAREAETLLAGKEEENLSPLPFDDDDFALADLD